MTIAYVLDEYPSLTETFIAREIAALRQRGIAIDVWAMRAGAGARPLPAGVLTRAGSAWAKWMSCEAEYSRGVGRRWAQQRREELYAVQHIHAGWSSRPASIAAGAAEVLGVPWSFSAHARDIWVENQGLAEKVAAAKFVACCTRSGAEFLKGLAPSAGGRVLYAPHGIEVSKYEFRAERRPHQPPRLLAVGRLVEKKGFAVLLDAMRESDNLLTIIGDGVQRSALEKLRSRWQLKERVTFAGALPHEAVVTAMQSADLLVAPSLQARDEDRDGLPNVLLEAAACGLPIVSTHVGGIPDFLDEKSAWLLENVDTTSLREAIHDAIDNFAVSLQRATLARQRVATQFDIAVNIEVLARAFLS